MITVALVDDAELIRTGFAMILSVEDDIEVIAEASNGSDAVALASERHPDVILMDVQMPVMDGIEATRQILDVSPDTRIIMLTTFDRDDYLFDSLQAGASGFLLKNADADDLVDAITVVAAGHALLAPEMTRSVIERFAQPGVAYRPERLDCLTEREREVLALIARGRSNAEIAGELFLGEATVKTHVSRVLMKLEVRDRVQAVVQAYECGLVRPGEA